MRRAAGPMVAAWLLATVGAIGVAWVAVHPLADLGFADRPPVPRPEVVRSPEYDVGSGSSDTSGPRGPRPGRPTIDSEDTAGGDPAPLVSSPSGGSPGTPKPPSSPLSPSAAPSYSGEPDSSPGGVYREASTAGGTAMFEYVDGSDVYVVHAEPKPGWDVGAHRYDRDWVVVEFVSADHRSEAHAYIEAGQPAIEVLEEGTTPAQAR